MCRTEHPNANTRNEHDRVVFLREEESREGLGQLQGQCHPEGPDVMQELIMLDWNTPRNLNKGKLSIIIGEIAVRSYQSVATRVSRYG